jgi:hypothetical protein
MSPPQDRQGDHQADEDVQLAVVAVWNSVVDDHFKEPGIDDSKAGSNQDRDDGDQDLPPVWTEQLDDPFERLPVNAARFLFLIRRRGYASLRVATKTFEQGLVLRVRH